MRITCIHVVLLVAIASDMTTGYKVFKQRRTDFSINGRKRRADVPFNCDSYMYLSQHLRLRLPRENDREISEIFDDGLITKEELNNLLPSICEALSNVASSFDMQYTECSNANTIKESLEHLGPLCLRSGATSTFATNLVANFTKATPTRQCNRQVNQANRDCEILGSLNVPPSSYIKELDNVRRIIKDRFVCALNRLNSAHACGMISDLKRGYLLVMFMYKSMPGIVYSMDDFFE